MKDIDKFAKIITSAVALKEGMCLSVTGEPEHRDFINAVAAAAYKEGAKYVHVETTPPEITKTRLQQSREEYLDYYPEWFQYKFSRLVDEKWCIVSLTGNEDPDMLQDCQPRRIGISRGAYAKLREEFLSAIASNKITWLVTGVPTKGWAEKVFGKESAQRSDLWEVLHPIYRLDSDSPIDQWRAHGKALHIRCDILNRQRFDSLEFKGPGTDLTVGLLSASRWTGGNSTCADSRVFFPNIPTEEVFTTPDFRRTSGRVALTRPVLMMGQTIAEGWFEFTDGKVTDYGAAKGAEILHEYFEIDPQAKFLGEIALVEEGNPIGRSGLVFHNILFDENAACHIALGNGYTDSVDGASEMEREDLLKNGINVCRVHTDLMFGSPDLDVFGITPDGRRMPIMKKGVFILS